MNKRIGIWMDFRHADVFQFEAGNSVHSVIKSNIPEERVKGGSRSRSIWGPMDTVSESKMLNRKLAARKKYYQHLAKVVEDSDEIVIIGPGAAKEEFNTYLIKECPRRPQIREVKTADSITLNQKKALVTSLF